MLYSYSTPLKSVRVLSQKKLLAVIAIVVVIVVIIGVSWVLTRPQQPTEELSTQEQARDDAMEYIKTSHSETAQFMNDLVWTGGRTTPEGIMGAETYTYTSLGWNVTITYPVVLNPLYTITADYSATAANSGASIPYRVTWKGTWDKGTVTETSYEFAQ
jgi:type II secretory pathway pseudopilin PulG